MEIDAILNECKIRPPSLNEKYIPYKRDVVFEKHYSQPTYALSLRPFVIPRDMSFVYRVLLEKYNGFIGYASGTLAASYLYAGSSDMMRSFTCLFNGRVILGTIDIVDALYDELCTMVPLCEGDYIIRLMINTKKETVRPLHLDMLTVCIEYFFQFPEINQLFIPLDPAEKNMIDLVQKCGFFFYDKSVSRYSSNIFCCTRQSLIVK